MNKTATLTLAGLALLGSVATTACSSSATGAAPAATSAARSPLVIEKPWVRSTEGAKDTSMSAAFMSISNPADADIRITAAESSVAGRVEVHEMAMVNGTMVMREAKDGIGIPAGGHEHLAPGGPHIMLMQLKQPLKVGDEVSVTVKFSDGSTQVVKAPVKKFTEEEDRYHTHAPATPAKG